MCTWPLLLMLAEIDVACPFAFYFKLFIIFPDTSGTWEYFLIDLYALHQPIINFNYLINPNLAFNEPSAANFVFWSNFCIGIFSCIRDIFLFEFKKGYLFKIFPLFFNEKKKICYMYQIRDHIFFFLGSLSENFGHCC